MYRTNRSSVMMLLVTCCLAVAGGLSAAAHHRAWRGRAIPVAQVNNQWDVLLQSAHGKWYDFSNEGRSFRNAEDAATQSLRASGVNVQQKLYWIRDQNSGDIFHFYSVNNPNGACGGWFSLNQLTVPLPHGQRELFVAGQNVDGLVLWALRDFKAHYGVQSQQQVVQQNVQGAQAAGTSWSTIPGAIGFYNRGQRYYEFTNFWDQNPIILDGLSWPTSEHYFQAQKFAGDWIQQQKISQMPSPRDVFNAVRGVVPANWHSTEKFNAMRRAIDAKFTQHQNLRNLLLGTGNAILVEDAGANDDQWGAGADGAGNNHLGRMLMVVRQSLKDNYYYPYDPNTTLTFASLQGHNFNPEQVLRQAAQQAAQTVAVTPYQQYCQQPQCQPALIASQPISPASPVASCGFQSYAQQAQCSQVVPAAPVAHVQHVIYYTPDKQNIVLTQNSAGVVSACPEACHCASGYSHRTLVPYDFTRMQPQHRIINFNLFMQAVQSGRDIVQALDGEYVKFDDRFFHIMRAELNNLLNELMAAR